MRISDWSPDVCSSDLLESQRVPVAIAFRHGRVGVGERDRGDPIAVLDVGLGLDCPREPDIGDAIVDEGDVAHARLHNCVLAPDILGTGTIVATVEARPALLFGRLREDRHERSEEYTSELQSLMRISYAVFCLTKKTPITSIA